MYEKICSFHSHYYPCYQPVLFFCGAATQRASWPPHSWGFLDHTQRRTTVSKTPLDEWSARRRDLYLTTHNTHNRQTSMPPVGFGPTISAGERPQTYALDRAATGTDINQYYSVKKVTLSIEHFSFRISRVKQLLNHERDFSKEQ